MDNVRYAKPRHYKPSKSLFYNMWRIDEFIIIILVIVVIHKQTMGENLRADDVGW